MITNILSDAGSRPKITGLDVKAFDIDPEVLKIAERNIREAGLTERVQTVLGDVVALPYADDSVDLVISRGSYMFWPDKVKAFREIRRVLKPGGIAYIGGGMGNLLPEDDRTRIREQMDKEKIGPPQELELTFPEMGAILRQAGIPEFKIAPDEGCLCGLWVEFRKPPLSPPDKTH